MKTWNAVFNLTDASYTITTCDKNYYILTTMCITSVFQLTETGSALKNENKKQKQNKWKEKK